MCDWVEEALISYWLKNQGSVTTLGFLVCVSARLQLNSQTAESAQNFLCTFMAACLTADPSPVGCNALQENASVYWDYSCVLIQ